MGFMENDYVDSVQVTTRYTDFQSRPEDLEIFTVWVPGKENGAFQEESWCLNEKSASKSP